MIQFLHIFKKDVRRHWPEILISLAILAIFTRHELRMGEKLPEYNAISSVLFAASGSYLPFFLGLSWLFVILRVVHSETLVGDRQWWVTKPCVWWQLLLAKVFLILIVIWLPLFVIQALLLHHAGFSVLHNLSRLFLMQFTLPFILIISAFVLASLTKNLAQAFLGIGIVIVVLISGIWLDSLSGHMAGGSSQLVDAVGSLLIVGSVILVPVWQFARRKTWASRALLAACLGAATVLSLIPFDAKIEETYSLASSKDFPAQFAVPPISESQESPSPWSRLTSDVALSIPVNVSGVPPDSVVVIDSMKVSEDSAPDSKWTRGWVSEYAQLWPGSQRPNLNYQIKRKDYERAKSQLLNLRIELALSQFQETAPRTLLIPAGIFYDDTLGVCGLITQVYPFLRCHKPFQWPAYIARFDAPNSPCKPVQRFPNAPATNLDVAYAWQPPRDERFPDPGFNPVVEYQLSFNPVPRIPDGTSDRRVEYSFATICPGAEIRLARPVFKRRFRVQLELPAVHLKDLVERSPL